MMKQILSAKDDIEQIGLNRVAINAIPVTNSKPYTHEGANRPLPRLIATSKIAADKSDRDTVGASR